ncbi:MAG: permease-like cell division protein FtsX [Proteobacteria bacterium]|nr:permease-like cell division protein FtsX [Pseudomonadota bacterium]
MSSRNHTPRRNPLSVLHVYVLRHLQVFFYSLGQLSRQPFATLMTVAVIGIALALPTGLHVILKNAQQLSGGWDGVAQISLFLKRSTTDKQARHLADQIRSLSDITTVSYISRDEALAEFRRLSGFGNALEALKDNPLPAVLVVRPAWQDNDPTAADRLLGRLQQFPAVDIAQLDMQWVKRLFVIMDIVRRGVLVLAALLALAVLLVVGNTIRLAIQNRRDEIVVMKLIGGTDAFIRRPFLYTGFWYGLLGGAIAWLLVNLSLSVLGGPIEQLAGLYQHRFAVTGLDLSATLLLLLFSILLGLTGSWLAVGRHLRDIEPS